MVSKFLTQHFAPYVDYEFTARMEDELDAVSRGEKDWVPLLQEFWGPFKQLVDAKEETVSRRDVTHEQLEEGCPKCGRPLSIRLGRHGRFMGCTAYPECDYTRNLDEDEKARRRAGGDRRAGLPGMRLGALHQARPLRQVHRMQQLSEVQIHRAAGEALRHRRACPECAQGTLLKRRSRQARYSTLAPAIPSAICGLERAVDRALPQMWLADLDPQDDQAPRHREGLPAEGMRIRRAVSHQCRRGIAGRPGVCRAAYLYALALHREHRLDSHIHP